MVKDVSFTVALKRNAWVGVGIGVVGSSAAMTAGGDGMDLVACSGGKVLRYWVTQKMVRAVDHIHIQC